MEGVSVVGSAKGGGEALSLVARLKPDVAFLDIQMPDLSGLEVARHLRGDASPVVVFVTAYDRHAIEAFELAALDYVLKPIKRERLAEAVRRAVQEVEDRKRLSGRQDDVLKDLIQRQTAEGRLEPLRRLPVRHRREVYRRLR